MLRVIEGGCLGFWCPGCDEMHVVNSGWTFDGNYDAPTLSPSVLVTNGHFSSHWKQGESCWCTFNAERPDETPSFTCERCHSFVRGGQIEFLTDSSHALAGRTVPMVQPLRD
jgi:hypothetical protein